MIRPLPAGELRIAGDDPELAITVAVTGRSLPAQDLGGAQCADAFGGGGEVFGAIGWKQVGGGAACGPLRQQHQRSTPDADESLEQPGFFRGQRVGAPDDHGRDSVEDSRIDASVRRACRQRRSDSAAISHCEPRIVFKSSSDEGAVPRWTRIEDQDRKARAGDRRARIDDVVDSGALTIERNRFNPQCSRAEIKRPPRNIDRRGRRRRPLVCR